MRMPSDPSRGSTAESGVTSGPTVIARDPGRGRLTKLGSHALQAGLGAGMDRRASLVDLLVAMAAVGRSC